jgi:hypothetical protein
VLQEACHAFATNNRGIVRARGALTDAAGRAASPMLILQRQRTGGAAGVNHALAPRR